MLAAFICQNTRADQDQKVFSGQGNGKRRNRPSEKMNSGDSEAFASSANDIQQLKSLRPRPVQIERVFSIFATLVRLNPKHFDWLEKQNALGSLGTDRLYKDFAELVDVGYLHPATFAGAVKGEQINLNNAKYFCSLTKEEAMQVAEKYNIPLENYIA